jgi:hypothetical protein
VNMIPNLLCCILVSGAVGGDARPDSRRDGDVILGCDVILIKSILR